MGQTRRFRWLSDFRAASRPSLRLAFAGFLVVPVAARAAQVLSVTSNQEQVTVSYETSGNRAWQLNDDICLYTGKRELLCGFVGRMTAETLTVAVTTRQIRAITGQKVALSRGPRRPASVAAAGGEAVSGGGEERRLFEPKERKRVDIALGFNAGLNYYYPTLTAQLGLGRTISLGLQGLFAKFSTSGVDVSAFGVFGLVTYYHTHFPFRGLFFQGGPGLFSIRLNDGVQTDEQSPIAFQAQVGWRGKAHFALGFDLGVGLGVLYVTRTNAPVIPISFSGVMPLFNAFLAYSL
jgi:hypothetical protein